MKRFGLLMLAAATAATVAFSGIADAKRLGGGGSLGAQRQSIAPKPPATAPGAAAQPVMPAQPGAALPAKPAAAPAVAPSGMSRWLGPIAGIAAGLGLAALLSHFGLPEGLGTFLLLALGAVAVVFVVRMLFARRTPATSPMQYAGAGRDVGAAPPSPAPSGPAWGGPAKSDSVMPAPAPAAAPAAVPGAKALPPGFDVAGFVKQAKMQYIRMQAAYDTGDRTALAELMTPEMFADVTRELAGRGEHRPTEVVTIDADVLEVTTEGRSHWASVRYTGLVREDGEPAPKPVDEVWNLTKPTDGSSGWLLAGIQQYA
jgi:predicted lipid-binding transport protein (Tim44 family)